MFDKLRQAHLHVHDWQQESLTFVPLRGTWFAQSEHSFDLEGEVNKFLLSDKRVLLLLGDSGSGKSFYTQGFASKLWQDHKPDYPIPVWISLPSLKNPVNKAIEETFERFGFNTEQIKALKQNNTFIFILDAFDEIHQLKNLWVSNHLDQWKAKIIITCRREYLYHVDNYKLYFTPFNGEKALYQDYDEMIIKSFSEEQIEQYIKQYIQHQKPEWSLEQYQKTLDEIPGLKNLIKTPFLLKLAMEALPKMPQEKEQKYMTQAKLYDVFIEQWFIRQEQKLKLAKKIKEDEDIKPEFWNYAKRLAQLMHQQKITQVNYDSSQSSDLFGEAEENPWQKLFNPDNPRIELLRTACLVREVGAHQYAFVHNSLLEYFLTRDLYENLLSKQQEVKAVKEASKSPQLETKKPQDYFNERLLVEETNTLQFLADRVDEDEVFKKTLFDRVYISKKNSQASVAASNALTILNRAQVPFSGLDLSDIHAPQADLTDATMSCTSLKDADLKGVTLSGAYLGYADFSGGNLENAKFGEYPALECGSGTVLCVCYNHDGQYLAVAIGNNIMLYTRKFNKYEKMSELKGHTDKVTSVVFSSDGKQIASGSHDRSVRLWDTITQQPLAELKGHEHSVYCVRFSPDSKMIASGSWNVPPLRLCLWDAIDHKFLCELEGPIADTQCIAFSPDGKKIISCGDYNLNLWDALTKKHLAKLKGHSDNVWSVTFSPDGKLIASGSDDKTVGLWDAITQKLLIKLEGHTDRVVSVVFSPDGKLIASGTKDKTIRLWDVSTKKPLSELRSHTDITSVAFNPNGNQIASGSQNGKVLLWDILIQKPLTQLRGHIAPVTRVVFSPDGTQIASGSEDNTVRLWDAITQKLLVVQVDTGKWPISGDFSPDGKQIAFRNHDNEIAFREHVTSVRLWDTFNQKLLLKLEHLGEASRVKVTFSPDGKTFVLNNWRMTRLWDVGSQKLLAEFLTELKEQYGKIVFSPDGKIVALVREVGDYILLYDISTQKPLAKIEIKLGERDIISVVTFSPDGKIIAVLGYGGYILLFDISTQKPLVIPEVELEEKDIIHDVVFNPDGKIIALLGDAHILLYDISTEKLLAKLEVEFEQWDKIRSVVFSPDGKQIASIRGKTVYLWSTDAQRLLGELKGHSNEHLTVAFSPDGKQIASYGDQTLCLWDAITGKLLTKLKGHTNKIRSVSFSPNGRRIVSGSQDKSIFLWERIYSPILLREEWILVYRFENSHTLFAESLLLKGAKISSNDLALLKQRGAKDVQVQTDISDEQEKPVETIATKDKENDIVDLMQGIIEQEETRDDTVFDPTDGDKREKLIKVASTITVEEEDVIGNVETKPQEMHSSDAKIDLLQTGSLTSEDDKLDKSIPPDSQNSQTFFQMPRDREERKEKTSQPRCCVLL